VVAVTQNGLRLAVHHDPLQTVGSWRRYWAWQVLDRYEAKIAADRVLKRLLPIFRKHVALTGT
jgi:hypothetical protein